MPNKYIKFHGISLADNSEIENLRIEARDSDPTAAAAGRLWYNSNEKAFKFTSLNAEQEIVTEETAAISQVDAKILVETQRAEAAEAALQSELDTTQSGAGLNTNGTYSSNGSATYISSASSMKDADNKLDAAVNALQGEVNTTQTGAGLNVDGSYSAKGDANYISSAASLKAADEALDAQAKANADAIIQEANLRSSADTALTTSVSNLQSELDTTQTGAGLGTDGTYSADLTTQYIDAASTLKDADKKLDAAIQAVQGEVDTTQTGAGLEADGQYAADSATNYLTSASSLKDADKKLDAQIKTNADAITTLEASLTDDIGTAVENISESVGLNSDGEYVPHVGTNYIDSATTFKSVDAILDGRAKTNADAVAQEVVDRTSAVSAEATARSDADADIQSELDATQVGAGLGVEGAYVPNSAADYINTASSLADADDKLDAAVNALQGEVDVTQTGAGLESDGQYAANTSTNYIATASSLKNADEKLDAQAKANFDNAQSRVSRAGDTMTGNLSMGDSFTVTNVPLPTQDDHVANKAYVDATAEGLDVKESARAATTGNVDLSAMNNGTEVDGVTLATGDRVLVKDQTDASENGIYVVQASGAAQRSVDFIDGQVSAGAFTFVEEGSVNGDGGFVMNTNGAITVGTTNISFVQFSGAGQIIAGAGIARNGNELFLNFGAGVVELPSDEIGLDLRADGSLMMTMDGSSDSTDADAKLAIRLDDDSDGDGATLTSSTVGLRVSEVVIDRIDALESRDSANQSEVDATQAGAGLESDGGYNSNNSANYIASASSLKDADDKLDAALKVEETARISDVADLQSELDTSQSSVGLAADGSFVAHNGSNYIGGASTFKAVDAALDAQAKVNADAIVSEASARSSADAGLQSELDTTQTGAGLEADGQYASDSATNYLTAASSLKDADKKLDAQIKTNADAITTLESSLTDDIGTAVANISTSVGLASDGSFVPHSGTNYIDTATTFKGADDLLDQAIFDNYQEQESLITDLESDIQTETAARIAGDTAIRTSVNDLRFTYQSTAAATQHTITHNLNSNFVIVQVMVEGDDGLYANDLVPVEETNTNTLTVYLTESRHIRVSVLSMASI